MKTKRFFVFKLSCGNRYYKYHGKGSWAVSLHGVSKKDISTGLIEKASRFQEPMDEPPYMSSHLRGGKWVEVEHTESFKELS